MSQLLTVALAQYPSGRNCMEIVAAAKAAAAESMPPSRHSPSPV
jgi:hypothetical protein